MYHHFQAARDGNVPIAALLLVRGVDIEAKDNQDRTPLICARGEKQAEMVAFLLDHGAALGSLSIAETRTPPASGMFREEEDQAMSYFIKYGLFKDKSGPDGRMMLQLGKDMVENDWKNSYLKQNMLTIVAGEEALSGETDDPEEERMKIWGGLDWGFSWG